MADLQNSGDFGAEERNSGDLGANSVRDQEEEDEVLDSADDGDLQQRVADLQAVRRSVSLDSVSALGISSVLKVDCSSGEGEMGQKWGSSAAMNRSVSCSGKFLMRSSTQRSCGTNQN